MEDHVPRHAQMGAWVLINDRWYNLMEDGADRENGEAASPAAAKKEPPSKAVKIIARAIEDSDGWVNLSGVGSRIVGAAPDCC